MLASAAMNLKRAMTFWRTEAKRSCSFFYNYRLAVYEILIAFTVNPTF